jgi:hypothetical protein
MYVMLRLFRAQCVQSLLRRDNTEGSQLLKHLMQGLFRGWEQKIVPEWDLADQTCAKTP